MYPVCGNRLQAPILKEDMLCKTLFVYRDRYSVDVFQREIDFRSKEYTVLSYASKLTPEERVREIERKRSTHQQ